MNEFFKKLFGGGNKEEAPKDEKQDWPLEALIERGDVDRVRKLASERGVEFIKMNSDVEELSALHYAANRGHLELVQFFLEPPVSENAGILRGNNFSPLHSSAMMGHTEIVDLLIKYGADVNVQTDPQKYAPIHSASFGGHLETIELLVENGADLSLQNYRDEYPIDTARRQNQTHVVTYFEKLKNSM